jgi:KipI family sensor histidine kinase inhibitor
MVSDTEIDTLEPVFLSAGDTALVVQYGETVDPVINRRVRFLAATLADNQPDGIVDLVPTMRSLMIHYDPLVLSRAELVAAVRPLIKATPDLMETTRRWRIPVCYEGECAPDMKAVAESLSIAPAEVIKQHSGVDQEVFMMGFLPGFPYLGLLPEIFDLPRRLEPRVKVPPRSISVAARQTTVYTVDSPGGWHLIGRTPIDFYNPHRAEPILVTAGDRVRFEPISLDAYHSTRQAVERDEFEIEFYALT